MLICQLTFQTVSPLYSGETRVSKTAGERVLQVRKTGDGFVMVPLKGVLRTYCEQILKDAGKQVCDISKNPRGCGKCQVCDLFGYLGKRGRMLVENLISTSPAREIVKTATHIKIDRESGTVSRGNSFKAEEVIEGSEFKGKIIIFNAQAEDLKLIDAGLKAIEEFGLGGWTTRGYGRVKLIDKQVETKSLKDFLIKLTTKR